MTFGEAITRARKDKKLSQKQVAAGTLKEDGQAISAQYLNDIEHDRRNPPANILFASWQIPWSWTWTICSSWRGGSPRMCSRCLVIRKASKRL